MISISLTEDRRSDQMKAFRNGITRILNVSAGISFIAMVILTFWQVLTRYILKDPSTWSEELVGYLFAWMSLLGASIVTCERGHMNIPILVERFNGIPIGFFYIVLPLCGILNAIYTTLNMIDILKDRTEEKEAV